VIRTAPGPRVTVLSASHSPPSPRCTETTSRPPFPPAGPAPLPPPHTRARASAITAPAWSCGASAAPAPVSLPLSGHRRRLHGGTPRLGGEERKRPPISTPRRPTAQASPTKPPKTYHRPSIFALARPATQRASTAAAAVREGVRGRIEGCTSTTRGCRHRWRPRRVGRQLRSRALCGPPPTRGCPETPTPPTPHSSGSPCSTCNFSLELSPLPRLRFDCFVVSFILRCAGSCGRRPAARLVLPRLLLPNLS